MDIEDLVERALNRDRPAIAKLISLVEDGGPDVARAMKLLYPHTGDAYTIGITGAPGAGKSTLTERLIARLRSGGATVGVLAVYALRVMVRGRSLARRGREAG